MPDAVAAKFAAYPPTVRQKLLALRALVLDVAAATPGVGRIEETLKWGQPSYLTAETGSGTTVRIDAYPGGGVAMFVHCQTNLVAAWRERYPELEYEGERAVILREELPEEELRHCIGMALTYHARKRGAESAPSECPRTLPPITSPDPSISFIRLCGIVQKR